MGDDGSEIVVVPSTRFRAVSGRSVSAVAVSSSQSGSGCATGQLSRGSTLAEQCSME